MTTTPEAAPDRMPEGLRQLFHDITITCDGAHPKGTSPTGDALVALGLAVVRDAYHLNATGRALYELLNAADMIQSAERDIAAAGYTYSLTRSRPDCWTVTLRTAAGRFVVACETGATLAAAMWEARSTAIARRL